MKKELFRWQIDEIKKSISEADRGEFSSEHDVQKVLKKWDSKESGNDEQADPS